MRLEAVFAITALSLLLSAPSVWAQGFAGVAEATCQQAVSDKVTSGNSGASDFAFGAANVHQSEMKTDIKGSGNFDSGKGKAKFSYSCAYDITTGNATGVQVTVQNATASN